MQVNGPGLSGYEQDRRDERAREAELEVAGEHTVAPAGPTRGEQLDRRLARDRMLREIHAVELQTQLNGAHWLETHARTACVVGGLISLPLWIDTCLPRDPWAPAPSRPEWLIISVVYTAAVLLSLGSICAALAWVWRKWTLWRATVRCLEVRDPARPTHQPPTD